MRTLGATVVIGAIVVAGCGLLPVPPGAAPALSTTHDAQGVTFTLDPWQSDVSTAFLCLNQPGDEFTASHPLPAAAAECQRLEATGADDRLTARFTLADVQPGLRDAFYASRSPWFLAVTGQRGPSSQALVISIEDSPIPSDAGPS